MSEKAGTSPSIISLPDGGGAVSGIGETFSPDLFTGTGNFSVPISVPPGRGEFQPDLSLVYSTGNGNGTFGLGWGLGVPGVRRKTAKGVPLYVDAPSTNSNAPDPDVFLLSGAEDLVLVDEDNGVFTYRPRTEGLYARIRHIKTGENNYWEVRSKNGNVSLYGTPHTQWPQGAVRDPATLADPDDPDRISNWSLTETRDPFGNLIRYSYEHDTGEDGERQWEQLYLKKIEYVDHGDAPDLDFLVCVEFEYEDRLDPFSSFRTGFEIRTMRRCTAINVYSADVGSEPIKEYKFVYAPNDELHCGASILKQILVTGYDGEDSQSLPPLEFSYSDFDPGLRKFDVVGGRHAPALSLSHPTIETVDLNGNALPDIVELAGSVARWWENIGDGEFSPPRLLKTTPQGLSLADPGVQFIDADGDGRPDLMVSRPERNQAGFFPMSFEGRWDQRSFRSYDVAPAVSFADPSTTFIDLDGDGVTDVLRTGRTFECYFNDNDPKKAWKRTKHISRGQAKTFPDVDLASPRVRTADMTGDGLQDIVIVHDGRIDYWPNTGHGEFGPRITMQNAPLLPVGYRPEHVLLGDVDGSGCSDLIYVEPNRVSLWINQQGNGFSEPIVIRGTPGITNIDALRLLDLYGTGTSGLLWSRNRTMPGQPHMFFLDFTGGKKPYLLTEMNNHMGAVTRVGYEPSTTHFLRDNKDPETRWKTPLPFPVQTVTRVEVIDLVSKGKLTTEYEYRHGYWDGFEREFRGFGEVIQRDTETFEDYNSEGFFWGEEFNEVDPVHFAPPLETRHWFHLGPIYDLVVGWSSPDFADEYWRSEPDADVSMLSTWDTLDSDLRDLSVRERRDALRALRGSTLRTELYARDGSALADRPYVVTEAVQSVRRVASGTCGGEELAVFFAFAVASRTTNWDRGEDPASSFEFVFDYDEYGQPQKTASIACPRGWSEVRALISPGDPFLTVSQKRSFIHVNEPDQYVVGRVSESKSFEVAQGAAISLVSLIAEIKKETETTETSVTRKIQGHQRLYYDGDGYIGLSLGELGSYGALTRSEELVFTESMLNKAYPQRQDAPDDGIPTYLASDSPSWNSYPLEFARRIDDLDGRAGYVVEDIGGEEHFFVTSARIKFDFQNGGGRGLMIGSKDPLGHETTVSWDFYDLLPTEVTDPAGMTRKALYDYRVFQPKKVTDPNGNQTELAFTPLGLLAATAVKGKEGEGKGDTLQDPGTNYAYDFEAFDIDERPVSVSTTTRVYHVNDADIPTGADPDETIKTIEYSDGFGRVIQARTQAEDLDFGDAGLTLTSVDDAEGTTTQEQRVRVTGWERFNNKGEVVEKWEPFFSESYDFEDVSESPEGQSIKVFFDGRGRTVRTLHPNGAEERVVFGIPTEVSDGSEIYFDIEDFEPTPWETYTFDANDNGGRSSLDASIDKSAFQSHFDTPASAVFDALGNVIEATQRNGRDPADWYVTKTTYDIRGNVISVTDPKDRVASTQVYDLADRVLRRESIDASTSIIAFGAGGTPIESKNARGARELTVVDELLRPTHFWGQDSGSEALRLVQYIEYGDAAELLDPEDNNLLGKPYIHRDEAGKLTFESYDFKGGLLNKTREVIDPALMIAAYEEADSGDNYEIDTFRVDWTPGHGETYGDREAALLHGTEYKIDTTYDALGRPKSVTYPEDVDGERKVLRPRFNRAGALQAVDLDGTAYVEHIAYNSRGQRILAAFGNGVMTRYAYDGLTFQLMRLRSEKYTKVGDDFEMAGDKSQDLRYTYDAVGNVLTIKSTGTGLGVDTNDYGHLAPRKWGEFDENRMQRLFHYDPLYRLIEATGREHHSSQALPWGDNLPGGTNYTDARPYVETYEYDEVGSVTEKKHEYANPSSATTTWTRQYHIDSASNRMTKVNLGAENYDYAYDAGGNLVQENTARHFEWDHAGNMRAFRNQVTGSQASVFGHYGYDAGGQRVQKVLCKSAGPALSTVYIDGIFEHHRIHDGSDEEPQNNDLHVLDDISRVALHRVGADIFQTLKPATTYHLGDNIGSSNVIIDGGGTFINREEYRPYGESAFGSYAKKRYRFTGKERDEESGLYYHGARYYAPWLCRWTAADPAGMVDGANLYAYVRGNPVRLVDPDGMQSGEEHSEGPPTLLQIGGTVLGQMWEGAVALGRSLL